MKMAILGYFDATLRIWERNDRLLCAPVHIVKICNIIQGGVLLSCMFPRWFRFFSPVVLRSKQWEAKDKVYFDPDVKASVRPRWCPVKGLFGLKHHALEQFARGAVVLLTNRCIKSINANCQHFGSK